MFYRRLGRTNLKISLLSIGGSVFDRRKNTTLTLKKAKEIFFAHVKGGVNLIDVAKEYGETFISKVMNGYKKDIIISVRTNADSGTAMLKDIKDSIKKLGIRPIPIYQTTISFLNNKVLDTMENAKKAGLINYIGIFGHRGNFNRNVDTLYDAIESGKIDVVEILYNPVHRIAERLFKCIKKHDVGLLAAAPFASGILAYEKKIREDSLRFLISNENVSSIVVGCSNLVHIQENIETVNKIFRMRKLSEGEREKLARKIENLLGKKFCRMCRYCECPRGIPIQDILKLLLMFEVYGRREDAKKEYLRLNPKFDVCNRCKECEKKCIYNLPIVKMLNKADKLLR